MKKSLAHLPKQKQTELMLITEKIGEIVPQAEMIFLYGSYARGDFKDGPHVQGRGRLTIRKRSDYDIFVVTRFAYTAKDTGLWDKVKAELAKMNLSTLVRISSPVKSISSTTSSARASTSSLKSANKASSCTTPKRLN